MRAHTSRVSVALLLAAGAAACSIDRPISPVGTQSRSVTRPGAAPGVLTTLENLLDTTLTTIVVDPDQTATYSVGGVHKLFVRSGGVCDPTSSYGLGTWDLPCLPATSPVLITAKSWYDRMGHPHVDFSPQLRFVPNATAASARLYLYDRPGAVDPSSVVLYCSDSACVDEALADTSLVTMRDPVNGYVYRRIKHFSGYEVAAGRTDSTTAQ